MGASGEALDVGSAYLAITLPATVFLGLGMALAAILRAVGDARRAMYVTLIGAHRHSDSGSDLYFRPSVLASRARPSSLCSRGWFRRRRPLWRGGQARSRGRAARRGDLIRFASDDGDRHPGDPDQSGGAGGQCLFDAYFFRISAIPSSPPSPSWTGLRPSLSACCSRYLGPLVRSWGRISARG